MGCYQHCALHCTLDDGQILGHIPINSIQNWLFATQYVSFTAIHGGSVD